MIHAVRRACVRHRTSSLRCGIGNGCRNAPRPLIPRHDLSTRRYCRPAPPGLQYAVRIGNVELDLSHHPTDHPELIPRSHLPDQWSPTLLRHLQWMLQKDALGQDMLLVGPPGAGAVYRRRLALMYGEMTGRETEVLTLSSDAMESDLKQRKELVHSSAASGSASGSGPNSASVEFVDQAPVRAALNGRLLILDGLHNDCTRESVQCGQMFKGVLPVMLRCSIDSFYRSTMYVMMRKVHDGSATDDYMATVHNGLNSAVTKANAGSGRGQRRSTYADDVAILTSLGWSKRKFDKQFALYGFELEEAGIEYSEEDSDSDSDSDSDEEEDGDSSDKEN